MNQVCESILILGILVCISGSAVAEEGSSNTAILPSTTDFIKMKTQFFLAASIYEVACRIDEVTGIIGGQEITLKDAAPVDMVEGEIFFNGHVLKAQKEGWLWDGSPDPRPVVKCVGNYRLLLQAGEWGSVQIGAPTEFPYFEKGKKEAFYLKMIEKEIGIHFEVLVDEIQKPEDVQPYLQYHIHFEYSGVVGRKPIPGVGLDVGEPIFASKEIKTNIGQRSEQYFGFWAKVTDRSFLLIQMMGKIVNEGDL